MNLFVVRLAGLPWAGCVGVLPFLIADFVRLALLVAFPAITLMLAASVQ